jgi:hypothetical protein
VRAFNFCFVFSFYRKRKQDLAVLFQYQDFKLWKIISWLKTDSINKFGTHNALGEILRKIGLLLIFSSVYGELFAAVGIIFLRVGIESEEKCLLGHLTRIMRNTKEKRRG